MTPEPVNFVHDRATPARPRRRSHLGLLSLGLVVSLIMVSVAYFSTSASTLARITNRPLLQQLTHLLTSADEQLQGEEQDRVNVLLVGIGGEGHEGAYLTDTIILASFKPSTKQIALLSIPRDLAVPIPGYGVRKINAANALGRLDNYPGGGEQLTADIVEEITGQPVHYFGRIDFEGFRELIDQLGGIQITVDQAFTDREYPTYDFGYQTVSFKAGAQRMSGETALKYVRSRHGNNGEGSDFARSRRQQKVLSALKDKMFSLSLLTSPRRMSLALGAFGNHARTDMEIWEMLRLASLSRGAEQTITTQALESGEDGLLVNTTGIDGAFLVEPRAGDWSEVHTLTDNIFTIDQLKAEAPRVAVSAYSRDAKYTAQVKSSLGVYNATVSILPADLNAFVPSVVYDISDGRKPLTAQALAKSYDVSSVSLASLQSLYEDITPTLINKLQADGVDFIFLLGPTKPKNTARQNSNARAGGS